MPHTTKIRTHLFVIRAIKKYQRQYPALYKAYLDQRDRQRRENKQSGFDQPLIGTWLPVPEVAYTEYIALCHHHLAVKLPPADNVIVKATLHDGAVVNAFYQKNAWYYPATDGAASLIDGIVLKYEKHAY